ncbi:hypothetical protein OF83DRAFT_1174135 [Amylostereum chailletii]|nr:hypothetical protein OF83DRAFT_1174135 [Amylostereum chailletii]
MAPDPYVEFLHDKYIFYASRAHICGAKIRENVPHTRWETTHTTAANDFASDPSRYPGFMPSTNAVEKEEFWCKCDAICPTAGPGDDPVGWARQYAACSYATQFIMNEEIPRSSVANTTIAIPWLEDLNAVIASMTGVVIPKRDPPPRGVLGQARLLDWVRSYFSTIDADGREMVYYVEDGGTTVLQGPFFFLRDGNGRRKHMSANEFEKMVEGLDIPFLDDED